MTKNQFWKQLSVFVIGLVGIILIREITIQMLLDKGVESYQIHTFVSIGANIIMALFALLLISKNGLVKLAGLKETKLERLPLLLFPFVYLVALNLFSADELNLDVLLPNILILFIYCLSIGVAEELSIRGFLQSHLIRYFGNTKRNVIVSVIVAALFFGLLHLFKFDKGLYGELSQIGFATFIGVSFGALLLVTKRIYPLIGIHAAIDFAAKLDSTGMPIKEKIAETTSLENSIFVLALTLPCLVYGLFLMQKYPLLQKQYN